ncbi:FAD-binding domain-containing protein [Mycena crocata]|nr:FAD-binding domain-containing protein [Mycena crocata]
MAFFVIFTFFVLSALPHHILSQPTSSQQRCRNVPGTAGYPDTATWDTFNATVSGRLVAAVPSAKYCANRGGCSDEEWTSSVFRGTIPGGMNMDNWEQGYDLTPPSLCLRNATTCGQGNVPLYSVEAETVADIQAPVKFASTHNLRVSIKASGHDLLGRSTGPNTLQIHTSKFKSITSTDAFFVNGQNEGFASTLGSGVHAKDMFQQTKTNGRIAVSGGVATLCVAGGYVQGAGHSSLSPTFGLAADNALEFEIVVASGELLKVNNASHPDLFYALRGGGAGSWGVIVSATFRTFPTFNATFALITLSTTNNTVMSSLATLHAKHIFDFDATHSSQYFWVLRESLTVAPRLMLFNYLINQTVEQGQATLAPFLTAALALPGVKLASSSYTYGVINDILSLEDDNAGTSLVMGSRLIPEKLYRDSPETVGKVYQQLLDKGTLAILGHLVAGGQVAANTNISSAVNPAWRTAKTHLIVGNSWVDSTPLPEINAIRNHFQDTQLPILEQMSGPDAGAYSNEADVMEPNFQTTFFGPYYAKLSEIKAKYDPHDLFIVPAGVGSERWDQWGLCTV